MAKEALGGESGGGKGEGFKSICRGKLDEERDLGVGDEDDEEEEDEDEDEDEA